MASTGDEQGADLADVLLSVARKITARTHEHPCVVPLTQLESLLMRHVDKHPGISPSRLAAGTGLKPSNASTALRSLEAKGFITREADTSDRRAVHIHPTRAAADNLRQVRQVWESMLRPYLGDAAATAAAVDFLSALDEDLSALESQ